MTATKTRTTAVESAVLMARTEIAPNTRCDRCRMASATTRLTFISGGVLYLCTHHYRQHELALETDPTIIIHTEPNTCPCHQCVGPRKD